VRVLCKHDTSSEAISNNVARLILALLGGFDAAVDDAPVVGFDTDKTRARLAYLGLETARPHSREALAGLLWPELLADAALRNLRNSLFKLRQALGEEDGALHTAGPALR
jgi:DNA-binding SARP family transcriptional activator